MLITVSEFERSNIINHLKIPEDKVVVLYNGASPKFNNRYSTEEIESFRATHKLPKNYIMFLGNTAPKKNTPNVIKAYVEYCLSAKEPIPLVLLDYKKELVEKFLDDLKQLNLIDHFIFPGYIPYDQIPLMYSAATLFLYPSLRESFGLPIVEAMACGTAVITSTTSSMPEIAGEAAKLVDPFNYQEITEAMKSLLQNESLRKNYIEKGLQRAKEFTWSASAEKLVKIYKRFQ